MTGRIDIIGLGGGDIEQLPLGIYKKLIQTKEKESIYARTIDHPVIDDLKKEGVTFESFDFIYEQESHFEKVYDRIVETLLNKAKTSSIIYAVPGHPMLAEQTVQLLLDQQEIPVQVIGGKSYLDDLFTALKIDPIDGFQFIDATFFNREQLDYQSHLIFCQVYDQFIASEVKLTLLEDLPVHYPVTMINAVGSNQQSIEQIPLEKLDRYQNINNLTTIYIPPVPKEMLNHQFNRLREIISFLRGPEGCEWDRAQTHESLREYVIEEVYELIEAIDAKDDEGIIEELGDVLLQVLLHSQIGEDQGYFTIDDVIRSITTKMIHRHPHVFGELTVNSTDEISKNWDLIKRKEKGNERSSILDGIPNNLPALTKAKKIQKKAASVNFDWNNIEDIWNKLDEELSELKVAIHSKDQLNIEDEFGDVLFSIVNLTRHYDVHPELALNRTNRKFMNRFKYIEKRLKEEGKSIYKSSLEEMDQYWDEAKERG